MNVAPSPSAEIEFATRRAALERTGLICGLVFAAVVLAAVFPIKINGAVVSEGVISLRGENIVIQHPDGGRVADVRVQNGMRVQVDDVLIQLDAETIRSERDRVGRQKLELDVRLARLRAALEGERQFTSPGIRGREGSELDGIVRTQSEALKAQQAALDAQIGRASQRARGANAARAALQGQIDANEQRRALIESEIADLAALVDEQLISRTRLTSLQRERLEIAQRLEALRLEDTRLGNEARSAHLEAGALKRNDTDRLWQEIEAAELKRSDLERQLETLELQLSRTTITAPVAGRVHEVSVRNAGVVVEPGATLLKLVPDGGVPQVRVKISPADIDDIAVGQSARLRFDTFQSLGAPEVNGQIVTISPDRSVDDVSGMPYYSILVDVSEAEADRFAALGAETGAPVTVLIETRRRSLATYLIEPVMSAFRSMFAGT